MHLAYELLFHNNCVYYEYNFRWTNNKASSKVEFIQLFLLLQIYQTMIIGLQPMLHHRIFPLVLAKWGMAIFESAFVFYYCYMFEIVPKCSIFSPLIFRSSQIKFYSHILRICNIVLVISSFKSILLSFNRVWLI